MAAKRLKKIPEIIEHIKKLMENETAGDPITGLKWTKKTTQKIADALNSIRIKVSKNTVGTLLKEMDYSLRVNCKKILMVTKNSQQKKIKIEINNSFILINSAMFLLLKVK